MQELWTELRQELAGLVLPVSCAGCGLPGVRGQLCEECAGLLGGGTPWRVRLSPEPPGLPPVHASLPYGDEVRAVLLAHKERGALGLATPLGAVLARAVRAAAGLAPGVPGVPGGPGRCRPLLLVPVPSARTAVAARGHDPARRIALAAARELRRGGVPARVLAVLRQRRATADQAGLTAEQRLANLSGALEAVRGTDRAPVPDEGGPGSGRAGGSAATVLVDDLMTTGASLVEAARAVHAARAADGLGSAGASGAGASPGGRIRRRRGCGEVGGEVGGERGGGLEGGGVVAAVVAVRAGT